MQDLIDDLRRRQAQAFPWARRRAPGQNSGKAANSPPGSGWRPSSMKAASRRSACSPPPLHLFRDGRQEPARRRGGDRERPRSAAGWCTWRARTSCRGRRLCRRGAFDQGGRIMHQSLKTGSPLRVHQRLGRRPGAGGRRFAVRLARVFNANVLLSGAVPQISLICGPLRRAPPTARRSPTSSSRPARPSSSSRAPGHQTVTGESVTARSNGRPTPMIHSGVIRIAEDDRHAIPAVPETAQLPAPNNLEDPPQVEGDAPSTPNPLLEPWCRSTQTGLRRGQGDRRGGGFR